MGVTVAIAAERSRRAAFPVRPRLLFRDEVLDETKSLEEAGLFDGASIVADMYPAIVTASLDHTAKVWNAQYATCEKTLLGHEECIHSALFGPDGRFIATGSEDSTAKLWLSVTGECWRTLHGHREAVYSVSFSPNGKWIATASGDHTARIWNVKNGTCQHILEGHAGAVFSARFTPDGSHVITDSRDGTIKEWNALTGVLDRTSQKAQEPSYPMSFAPDGLRAVTAQGAYVAKIIDVKTGNCVKILDGHTDVVISAAYAPAACSILNPNAEQGQGPGSPSSSPKRVGSLVPGFRAKA
jgi:WD40 repeat protein